MSDSTAVRFPALPLEKEAGSNAFEITSAQNQPEQIDDETLIYRMRNGDRDACSCLFKRFAQTVRNVGRRIVRNNTEADDLVQEVFLYIHRKSALFDSSKGSARSWIIQVAYTQALLRRRELTSHGFYQPRIADRRVETEQASDKGAHYDHTVEGLFGRNGWKKILEDLTEDQRETFRLHFFQGYTFAEIAEELGQSFANVRNHHYRGLEKLRSHLAESQLKRR
jgi:RNA polymerase sigma-70 factor (ECF subfamily)